MVGYLYISCSDTEDKKVWDAFRAGDFSCQKTDIPGMAIDRDHAGEQESRRIVKLRTVGVLKVLLLMKTAGQDTLLPQFFVRCYIFPTKATSSTECFLH